MARTQAKGQNSLHPHLMHSPGPVGKQATKHQPALKAVASSWVRACVQSCLTLRNPRDHIAHQALCPWDSPGKNTGVGCHALLQRIFLTQGLNPRLLCLLHW